jgi:hypothetical protein
VEYKTLLGSLAVAIEILSYIFYFVGIWQGKTKPHAFTWLVFSILNIIGFFAALVKGGYIVAWVLGINAVLCLAIFFVGVYQKRVNYDLYDWLALLGAFLGIILWCMTHDPLYAVILISVADFVAMTPTIRKAYKLPFEENLESFLLGISYYILSVAALDSFETTNWLYPAAIVTSDLLLIGIIMTRRQKLSSLLK